MQFSSKQRVISNPDNLVKNQLVFYESSHRIGDSLSDMCDTFGRERHAVIARELTKKFEQVHGDNLAGLVGWLQGDPDHLKGEFVVLIAGALVDRGELTEDNQRLLEVLLEELPVKKAAALAAAITGKRKKDFYDEAIRMKNCGFPREP